MRLLKTCFLVSSLVLGMALGANATTVLSTTDDRLADAAELIAHVRITEASVAEAEHGIVTRYRAAPLVVLKGSPGPEIAFELPGGVLSSGLATRVIGVPTLAPGEQVLVFLAGGSAGSSARVVANVQGIFQRGTAEGEVYWQRATADQEIAAIGDDADAFWAARHAERFEGWLQDRGRGVSRPVDYLAADVRPSLVLPPSKFTRLRENPPVRRFDFDAGGSVEWFRQVPAGFGDVSVSLAALRDARRLWNGVPRARIRYLPGGALPGGSSRGRSLLSFMSESSDCADDLGATIFTVITLDFADQRPWKGESYASITGSEIRLDRGAVCLFDRDPLFARRLLARSLGLSLGLGSSCGGSRLPACVAGTPAGDALMATFFGFADTRPVTLGSDDIAGARFLYDPSFEGEPQVPCELPPGDPRFCTECGPCAAGFGDCDRDTDCAPGLSCVDDQGARFGYAGGIDVCLPNGNPGPGCDPADLGTGRYCTDCGPCAAGQGDCDSDAECVPGTQCVDNVGGQFGFAAGVDVCLPGGPPPECTSQNGRGDFCALPGCGPCGIGEGDCDSDAECAPGLRCVDDIGPLFGFGPRTDVCQ